MRDSDAANELRAGAPGSAKEPGINNGITRANVGVNITSSLEELQTDEQRRVLDTVVQVRKCGLESILSLPQVVVCGDQSAGKSSVLEALTEIPFPRNDNLCTRFATEIILRRAASSSLSIKIIPDAKRPPVERESIESFSESITDFAQLPTIMAKAMTLMSLDQAAAPDSKPRAFARDVLSIEIEGPSRPQLTLVDIPGLIQTETKGVTKADKDLVTEITDHYISQPRTICLAVVSATNDYANQPILTKVREVDPRGDRTLGIITKPDRLPAGSGSETAFLELARNEDIFFKLGWHVLKNRAFEEGDSSFEERNASEATFFRKSNFSSLSNDCVGIESLRIRLSLLLFEHVRRELPNLQNDLNEALSDARDQLSVMGDRRTSPSECRSYLAHLSLNYYEISRAAVEGHYEDEYFHRAVDETFSIDSPTTLRRFRAVVQFMNESFYNQFRIKGHKYQFDLSESSSGSQSLPPNLDQKPLNPKLSSPIRISKKTALDWVGQVLIRNRGRELSGNYNPLLIGELFWEQSSKWHNFATSYVDQVAQTCSKFLEGLFSEICPKDVRSRLWSLKIEDALKCRHNEALEELGRIMEDNKSFPINYNRYYTDTICKRRQERQIQSLTERLENATQHVRLPGCQSDHTSAEIDIAKAVESYSGGINPDMEHFSCEEALDCLIAIYKISQKTFIANVTTQVIERHLIRGLKKIFSPIVVNGWTDAQSTSVASEPASTQRRRSFLEDRITKLESGRDIFRTVMGSVAV